MSCSRTRRTCCVCSPIPISSTSTRPESAPTIVPPPLLERALAADSLLIAPHRSLHLLSWPALTFAGRRLFEHTAVGLVPNLTCMIDPRRRLLDRAARRPGRHGPLRRAVRNRRLAGDCAGARRPPRAVQGAPRRAVTARPTREREGRARPRRASRRRGGDPAHLLPRNAFGRGSAGLGAAARRRQARRRRAGEHDTPLRRGRAQRVQHRLAASGGRGHRAHRRRHPRLAERPARSRRALDRRQHPEGDRRRDAGVHGRLPPAPRRRRHTARGLCGIQLQLLESEHEPYKWAGIVCYAVR